MQALREEVARGGAVRLSGPLAAAVAAVGSSAALVFRPAVLLPAGGALVLGWLAFTGTAAAVAVLLTARNLADAASGAELGAALNAGALVGLVAIAVALLRLARIPAPRGVLPAAGLLVFITVWYFVALEAYGPHDSVLREGVRSASLIAVALVALNARELRHASTLAGAVVAAGIPPAVVAIFQLAAGAGFEGSTRAYGTLGHPNSAAALFGICLAVAIWKLVEERRWRLYGPAALVLALALLATQSIGGVARILITLLAYALLAGRLSRRARGLAWVAMALATAFALSPLGSSRVEELRSTASPSEVARGSQTNSFDWRLMHWLRLVDDVRERPLVGHGLGTTYEIVAPDGFFPHSDPLRLLLETGVVGFVVLGAAFAALWATLLRRARARGPEARYAALATAVLAGLTVHALVDNIHSQTAAMYATAVLVGSALRGGVADDGGRPS